MDQMTSTQCFEGTQDFACGSGGGECSRCSPSTNGGHCVTDSTGGGHCEGAGKCSAANCAGCCSGDLCVEGTQDVGCGSKGAQCTDCTMDGGVCIGFVDNPNGVVGYACGYGCLGIGLGCSSYCISPTNCTSNTFNNDW
jgi:hypothetical protein